VRQSWGTLSFVNWDDWRVFQVLSEVGSLGKAARDLGVDHSTVSRRLASLEETLGTQLAQRSPSGLELTAAGQAVAAAAMEIKDLIAEVSRRVGGEDERAAGVVRISTTPGLAAFVLRGLPELHERYPEIRVEVIARVAVLDLVRREADIALRLVRPDRGALISRKLCDIGWSLYASEEYLLKRDAKVASSSLQGHDVIGYDESVSFMPGAKWLNEQLDGRAPVMVCGDPSSARSAILAGLGVSTLPCLLAEGERGLRRLTPDVLARAELFMVIPPDHKNTVRVRVTMDHLVERFTRHGDMLAGRSS
jgi:DNA-binding transcriptional LysR family regulator